MIELGHLLAGSYVESNRAIVELKMEILK